MDCIPMDFSPDDTPQRSSLSYFFDKRSYHVLNNLYRVPKSKMHSIHAKGYHTLARDILGRILSKSSVPIQKVKDFCHTLNRACGSKNVFIGGDLLLHMALTDYVERGGIERSRCLFSFHCKKTHVIMVVLSAPKPHLFHLAKAIQHFSTNLFSNEHCVTVETGIHLDDGCYHFQIAFIMENGKFTLLMRLSIVAKEDTFMILSQYGAGRSWFRESTTSNLPSTLGHRPTSLCSAVPILDSKKCQEENEKQKKAPYVLSGMISHEFVGLPALHAKTSEFKTFLSWYESTSPVYIFHLERFREKLLQGAAFSKKHKVKDGSKETPSSLFVQFRGPKAVAWNIMPVPGNSGEDYCESSSRSWTRRFPKMLRDLTFNYSFLFGEPWILYWKVKFQDILLAVHRGARIKLTDFIFFLTSFLDIRVVKSDEKESKCGAPKGWTRDSAESALGIHLIEALFESVFADTEWCRDYIDDIPSFVEMAYSLKPFCFDPKFIRFRSKCIHLQIDNFEMLDFPLHLHIQYQLCARDSWQDKVARPMISVETSNNPSSSNSFVPQ